MKCNIPKNINTNIKLSYGTLQQLTENKNTNHFKEGEIVYLTDEKKCMMYTGTEWIEIQHNMEVQGKSNIEMTSYDINKQLMSQLPVIKDWTEIEKIINNFATDSQNTDFMLLCKEISYYTIFQKTNDVFVNFSSFGESVLTCANDIGDIVSVDYMKNSNTIEIWVRKHDTKEDICMVLFDCHDFIVTYAGV